MAKQNPTAANDVYTAILALAWLTVCATTVYVSLTCWFYFGNEMFSFAVQALR